MKVLEKNGNQRKVVNIFAENDTVQYQLENAEVLSADEVEMLIVEDSDDFDCDAEYDPEYQSGSITFTLQGAKFTGWFDVRGKAYHYADRDRWGQLISPEENGFKCTEAVFGNAEVEVGDTWSENVVFEGDYEGCFDCDY